jgi:SAM-dependent methyltransferase
MEATMEPNLHTDADNYQAGMGSWSKTLAPLFIEFIDGIKERNRVLDVGCGTGSLTFTIADTTKASKIVGIDPSVGYLEYARCDLCPKCIALNKPQDKKDRSSSS